VFDWNLEEFKEDCPSLQLISFSNKSFLYKQGEKCSNVFLIKDGIVKLSHITPQGNELTYALLKGGDVTGCLDVCNTNQGMQESVQALTKVDCYRVECNDFKRLVTLQAGLSAAIFTSIYIHKQKIERKLIATLTQSVKQRVITMLLELAQLFGTRCVHGYALEIFLTQQELADLVGASRSVVSTVMNNFRELGILDYTREQICINDSALTSVEFSSVL
jgi:CRP-like cAMP-binding protein